MSDTKTESPVEGTIPAKVALLPDSCFFVRSLSLLSEEGAPSVEEQVRLSLEAISPFPISQLFLGHKTDEKGTRAFVYAAYRRRFSTDEVANWEGLDWVVPRFATLLNYPARAGTAVVYSDGDTLSLVHWNEAGLPAQVLTQALPADLEDAQRDALVEALLTQVQPVYHVVRLDFPPTVESVSDSGVLSLAAGAQCYEMTEAEGLVSDIRSDETIEGLVRGRKLNDLLWKGVLALVAVFGLCFLGEGALLGLAALQRTQTEQIVAQRPQVEKIESSQALAFRIEELATKRLLPFEMITLIHSKKPPTVQFLTTTAGVAPPGINALRIEALTGDPTDLSAFKAALEQAPEVASVEVSDQKSRDRKTSFTMLVHFQPAALKPASE